MKKSIIPFLGMLIILAACNNSSKTTNGTAVTADTLRYPEESHFKNIQQLTFGGDNAEAYWSFDGKMLVFQRTNPKDGGPGELLAAVDVVFPVLHGPYGEDGTIQGLLELAGIPYVGSGVLSSAAGMDKEFTKKLLAAEGLPIGDFVVLRPRPDGSVPTLGLEDRERLGLPVFVKPSRGGSSIGVSRVSAWDELPAAIELARRHDPKVIVEAAIPGRELECGVLEFPDGSIEASTVGEIRVAGVRGREDGFYDFATKYLVDAAELDVPAKVDDDISDEVRRLAVRAFTAIDCQGLARVDFFLTDDGPVINEINTMPGFTTISMFPRMWAASGVDYPSLVDRLIRLALRRDTGLR